MTASGSLRNTLGILMKDVSDGLQLDSADRYEDAYRKYLECMLRVTTTLLKKLHGEGGHLHINSDVFKCVKLAQQCMDRVSAIVNDKYVPASGVSKRLSDMSLSLTSPTSSLTTPTTPSPRSLTSLNISTPNPGGVSVDRWVTNQRAHTELQMKIRPTNMSGDKFSPMALASRQNQQLLLAFKARQVQAQKRNNRSLSANLSLTLQRKMAENIAIAKAQEEALAKKMLQRQARLEEQAARRFGTPVGLSEEEQHQRHIYRRVLQFELEQPHMKDIKTRFDDNPQDYELINELLLTVLRCEAHPLTEQLKIYQDKILDKLYPLVGSKTQHVEKVKVPLSEELCKVFSLKSIDADHDKVFDDSVEESKDSSIEKDIEFSKIESESEEVDNSNQNTLDKDDTDCIDDKHKESSPTPVSDETGVEKSVNETRKSIRKALDKGEQLRERLVEENESLKSLALYSAGEYDKYNQENMDDLFEEDDDSDDDDDILEPVDNTAKSTCDNSIPVEDRIKDVECELLDDIKIQAYKRHLNGIIEDIVTSIEQLAILFVVVYDKLDSAEGKDQCNAELEASFFRPLWKHLLVLFRLSNTKEELTLAAIMTNQQDSHPAAFSVRDKLCLTPSTHDAAYPYKAAIVELVTILDFHTMLEKLECIVRTSKLVMQCVEQYYTYQNTQAPSIGADDLVPVLCYVVVRSGLPQIVSECQAVEKFLHEGYMFGEEGYCLTSFQTAIDYLTSTRCQLEP